MQHSSISFGNHLAPFMLGTAKPDVLHLSQYLDKFSERRTVPTFSIPTVDRFDQKREDSGAGKLGPGEYKVCRDFPENHVHEYACHFSTKCVAPAPKYSFDMEERAAKDGGLKGISNFFGKTNPKIGPGYYNMPSMESRVNKRVSTKYSIPKAKESQEAIRERKMLNLTPGPGTYTRTSKWDELDREQSKLTKKLAKKATSVPGKAAWVAHQYKQIFAVMKMSPGSASAPALKGTPGAARKS